jgi:hypothetical protein
MLGSVNAYVHLNIDLPEPTFSQEIFDSFYTPSIGYSNCCLILRRVAEETCCNNKTMVSICKPLVTMIVRPLENGKIKIEFEGPGLIAFVFIIGCNQQRSPALLSKIRGSGCY